MKNKLKNTIGLVVLLGIGMIPVSIIAAEDGGACAAETPGPCDGGECLANYPAGGNQRGQCVQQDNPRIEGDPHWCFCIPAGD